MTIQLWGLLLFLVLVTFAPVQGAEPVCGVDEDCSNETKPAEDDEHAEQQQQHDSKSWFEDASKDGLKFLQENVFGQKPKKIKGQGRQSQLERTKSFGKLFPKSESESGAGDETVDGAATSSGDENEKGILDTLKDIFEADDPDQALLNFLLSKTASNEDTKAVTSFEDTAKLFLDHVKEIMDQLQRVLGSRLDELIDKYFYLPSAWYLLRAEQERKHSYWKTAQHKFYPKSTDTEYFRELHRALYLSNLAYVDTEQELNDGMKEVENDSWQLLYTDMQGNPREPAHFLAVQKQSAPLPKKKNNNEEEGGGGSFWQRAARSLQGVEGGGEDESRGDDNLKVLLVVRGTKTVGDILSDGLLEATTYKEKYKAHGGIASSGQYIVNKHIERINQLSRASGRHIQLLLFGHSLGCGTASIAAMELHDNYQDIMTVRAVGFGCPSLVSPELSEKYKDIITTVIADADVVPRLSGSSIVNLHLSMMSLDWTEYMWEELKEVEADIIKDVTNWTNGVGTKFVSDLLQQVGDFIHKKLADIKPNIHSCRDTAIPAAFPVRKADNELIPPGTCLHLYRTATGFEAAYTPCTFFDEIEYVPHLVDDHLSNGYHVALLTLLRQGLQDHNAVFENELYP